MNESEALSTAKKYASVWSVPWTKTVDSIPHQSGIWIFKSAWAFSFKFESDSGIGEIDVLANSAYRSPVDRLEFLPFDPNSFLLPPWAAFPGQSRISSLWRQGSGEAYWNRWYDGYVSLPDHKKREYEVTYPPPDDQSLCFDSIYEYCRDEI